MCSVDGCQNTAGNSNAIFHRLDSLEPERTKKWLEAVKLKPKITEKIYVCSDHFEDNCFASSLRASGQLLPCAVPSRQVKVAVARPTAKGNGECRSDVQNSIDHAPTARRKRELENTLDQYLTKRYNLSLEELNSLYEEPKEKSLRMTMQEEVLWEGDGESCKENFSSVEENKAEQTTVTKDSLNFQHNNNCMVINLQNNSEEALNKTKTCQPSTSLSNVPFKANKSNMRNPQSHSSQPLNQTQICHSPPNASAPGNQPNRKSPRCISRKSLNRTQICQQSTSLSNVPLSTNRPNMRNPQNSSSESRNRTKISPSSISSSNVPLPATHSTVSNTQSKLNKSLNVTQVSDLSIPLSNVPLLTVQPTVIYAQIESKICKPN